MVRRKPLGVTREVSKDVQLRFFVGGVLGVHGNRLRYKNTYRSPLIACHCETLLLVTSFGDEKLQTASDEGKSRSQGHCRR